MGSFGEKRSFRKARILARSGQKNAYPKPGGLGDFSGDPPAVRFEVLHFADTEPLVGVDSGLTRRG